MKKKNTKNIKNEKKYKNIQKIFFFKKKNKNKKIFKQTLFLRLSRTFINKQTIKTKLKSVTFLN